MVVSAAVSVRFAFVAAVRRRGALIDGQARSLLALAGGVLVELDLDVVVDRVLQSASELTGERYAAVGVLGASRTELERFITVGVDEQVRLEIGGCREAAGCSAS